MNVSESFVMFVPFQTLVVDVAAGGAPVVSSNPLAFVGLVTMLVIIQDVAMVADETNGDVVISVVGQGSKAVEDVVLVLLPIVDTIPCDSEVVPESAAF